MEALRRGLRSRPIRSHGLSISKRHRYRPFRTVRMHWCSHRAVSAFACQMGARTSSTSTLVTSETGTLPMGGKAYRLSDVPQ